MFAGGDVHGATLGILGMGRIGQAIARRGALGFGMKVIYHNRTRLAADVEAPLARALGREGRTAARRRSPVIVVVPYSPESHHAIGAAELALMKPTATLTNIARGGIVDDAALARRCARAASPPPALDVFEGEPKVHPDLLAAPKVVLTPHIASASVATRRAMANLAVDNLIAALSRRHAADAAQSRGAALPLRQCADEVARVGNARGIGRDPGLVVVVAAAAATRRRARRIDAARHRREQRAPRARTARRVGPPIASSTRRSGGVAAVDRYATRWQRAMRRMPRCGASARR